MANGARIESRMYAIDYALDLFSKFTCFPDDPVIGDQFEQVDHRRVCGGDLAYSWSGSRRIAMNNTLGASLRPGDIDEVGLHRSCERVRD